ncbi:hypothetical protein TSTA_038140 [Talaromyces stipitatus ATCC 10500]|uniref:Zn(2)-C6 fungal-type domain-containing protein n=1 Tax=Talaromyces stipitatus (strain ATCC 10500 / CBS 375.48 / QM 6759 / NRRL 1006) TaxID=441959 RepID=B8M8U0_TALSN|nr:uncharacterized protein TSTA_038140 [Talaromyces stipitatus ATCC 10500]EED20603.1 hypothetical protein TSTA_038140 [Talaromyces stipitatus ATCC 10500]
MMMNPTHLTPLEGRHHQHPLHHPEVVQQPRRFACDRCRMQKLRCERDIWRPSLMPCKRCRKARIACTISSMDRPVSKKKTKDRVLAITKPEKTTTGRHPQGTQEISSPLDVSDQLPVDNTAGFYPEAIPREISMIGTGLQSEDCYLVNSGFEEYQVPVFSGLITPPSMDNEQERQIPLQTTSFPAARQQDWTPESDCSKGAEGYEFDDPFPCLDDREQWWDQENLRRLLDMNMHLLDCQSLVAQELAMLGNMHANVALTNLESASRNVLRYSQQFLEVVNVFVDGGLVPMATVFPRSMAVNAFAPHIHTPVNSRRPSYVQQTPTSTIEPILVPGAEAAIPPQITPLASFTLPSSGQPSWQGTQFEDVQVSLILATINCYTCLIGSYHIILSYLLHELMAVVTPEQQSQSSSTFPDFATPFAVTAHVQQPDRDSQLRLIFHNCMGMLAQLELSLGLPEQHCVASWALSFPGVGQPHRHDGVLSGPVAAILVNTLVNQKFGLCVNGLATGKNSMKDIIATINQFFEAGHAATQVIGTVKP